MTQEAIQITETPPLPGPKLVQDTNKALQTIATNFAGPDDPAALAGPLMTWADTGSTPKMLRRRNEAGTAWVTLGPLLPGTYLQSSADGLTTEITLDGTPRLKVGSTGEVQAFPFADGDRLVRASGLFGVGQGWRNVTPSRSKGVSYNNSTGKPIAISIYWTHSTTTQGNIITSVTEGNDLADSSAVSGGGYQTARAVIAAGANYAFNTAGTVAQWLEFRS